MRSEKSVNPVEGLISEDASWGFCEKRGYCPVPHRIKVRRNGDAIFQKPDAG
jgi:hypothetical protein